MNRLLFLLPVLFLASCEETVDSVIPRTRVEVQLNTRTTGLDFEQNGYKLISSVSPETPYIGFGGILLVKGYTSASEVYAFDLACPVEIKRTTRLTLQDGYKAVCPSCKSEFDVIRYGNPSPTAGPAKEQRLLLRQYNANYSEANYLLSVFN